MKGQQAHGTGDINLAALFLTMGIPSDPIDPVKLIASDNGKDYVRFFVLSVSIDGLYDTAEIGTAWNDPKAFRSERGQNPISSIMEFIRSRPKGCKTPDDWLAHASAFLGYEMDAVMKIHNNIGKVCKSQPEHLSSYIVAFCRNRSDLVTMAKMAEKKGNIRNMQNFGPAFSLIPAKAPRRIKDYLLSHVR
jgi:hypothetical protein